MQEKLLDCHAAVATAALFSSQQLAVCSAGLMPCSALPDLV